MAMVVFLPQLFRKFEMNVSSEYLAVRFRIDTGDGYSASGRRASGAVVLYEGNRSALSESCKRRTRSAVEPRLLE